MLPCSSVRTLAACVLGSLIVSCTKQVPPPSPPPRSLPAAVANEEDALDTYRTPNTSLVVITSDVPAKVERVMGIDETPTARRVLRQRIWETICPSTPCSVRLPRGDSTLLFVGLKDASRESITTIRVGTENAVVNHTLGQERGSVGTYVGVGLVVVGLAALVFPYGFDLDQPKAAPSIFVASGIGAIFGGLTLMGLDPSIKQPGATTTWTPERQPQQPGASSPPPTSAPQPERSLLPAMRGGAGLGFVF